MILSFQVSYSAGMYCCLSDKLYRWPLW